MLFACQSLGVEPQAALMVGDSIHDAKAARAAGIAIICVTFGYNEGSDPHTLSCDLLIDNLGSLPDTLLRKG